MRTYMASIRSGIGTNVWLDGAGAGPGVGEGVGGAGGVGAGVGGGLGAGVGAGAGVAGQSELDEQLFEWSVLHCPPEPS